jgi:hypothetical protein
VRARVHNSLERSVESLRSDIQIQRRSRIVHVYHSNASYVTVETRERNWWPIFGWRDETLLKGAATEILGDAADPQFGSVARLMQPGVPWSANFLSRRILGVSRYSSRDLGALRR